MIYTDDEDDTGVVTLFCDHCQEDCEEIFHSFVDAVAYKTDKSNGWMSIKQRDGSWVELCPNCASKDIIALYVDQRDDRSMKIRMDSELAKLNTAISSIGGFE